MGRRMAGISTLAALSLFLAIPATGRAQTWSNDGVNSQGKHNQNAPLVGTRSAIESTLDAKNAKPGQTFKVKLADNAKMGDGEVLPEDTVLIGKLTQDDTNLPGKTKLALCIDQAQLKNGKTMPVRAYVVGLFPANGGVAEQATPITPGNQGPNPWKPGIQEVDQIDALNGIDLHSQIGDKNSAVLVSNKNDIKLKAGTELALAVGPANGNGQRTEGTGGGR